MALAIRTKTRPSRSRGMACACRYEKKWNEIKDNAEEAAPTHQPTYPDVITAWDRSGARRLGPAQYPVHLLHPASGSRCACGCGAMFYRPGGERSLLTSSERQGGRKLTSLHFITFMPCFCHRRWTRFGTRSTPLPACFAKPRFSWTLSAKTVRAFICMYIFNLCVRVRARFLCPFSVTPCATIMLSLLLHAMPVSLPPPTSRPQIPLRP